MKIYNIMMVTVFATASLLSCNAQKGKAPAVKLKSQLDSVSYAIGISLGDNFKKDKLDSLNLDVMYSAIRSVMAGDSLLFDTRACQPIIQNYFGAKQKKEGE